MNIVKLIASFVIVGVTAFMGSIFTSSSVSTWYQTIQKPGFTPPDWVFGPVWTILYILMAVALYLVWKKGMNRSEVKVAFWVFVFHLLINALWSLLFFSMQFPAAGFIVIVTLWILIVISMGLFWRVDRRAMYLLVPYILWVSYALALNYSIWKLNG